MLARLLKSLLHRRVATPPAPPPAGTPAPITAAPPTAAGAPAPIAAAPQSVSTLAVLSRLASLASGQELRVTGKEARLPDEGPATRTELPIGEIIARAAALGSGPLAAGSEARVERFATAFSRAARAGTGTGTGTGTGMNVFVFHVDLAPGTRLDYVDATLEPGHFDYLDILRRFIDRVRASCDAATVYVVTSEGARYRVLAAPDVAMVELPIDGAQPMYDRATALAAYARSAAFDCDTVFLDSDALVNRPLAEVFRLGFDVGLTYREAERLMPVNEGVLFLAARRPGAVRRFLEERLASYDRIATDPFVTGYYGDVRRWRGGQLSLNALAHPLWPCSPYRRAAVAGAIVRLLPCDTFNFAVAEGEAASSVDSLDQRYVVHFKGWRKYAFGFAAQAETAPRAAS